MSAKVDIWAVVPAAGIGARMGAAQPKQYLWLRGRAVILHTLERLCSHDRIRGVVVGISPQDQWWRTLDTAHLPQLLGTFVGGESRAQTVLNGLQALTERAGRDDWVMVHDAVRPCVRSTDIDKLIAAAMESHHGALLAQPLTDTVKRATGDGRVDTTLPRARLWCAATPQMFRLRTLTAVLAEALATGVEITDESMAIERAGGRPQLVSGSADNIKITMSEDLALAEWVLARQERGA